jgi:hypothetical protein
LLFIFLMIVSKKDCGCTEFCCDSFLMSSPSLLIILLSGETNSILPVAMYTYQLLFGNKKRILKSLKK